MNGDVYGSRILIATPTSLPHVRATIDSIVKGLETAHVGPLKRVRTPRAILVTSCYELSQFRAPEKERTRKIKDEEDASSRSYEIFNNIITFCK